MLYAERSPTNERTRSRHIWSQENRWYLGSTSGGRGGVTCHGKLQAHSCHSTSVALVFSTQTPLSTGRGAAAGPGHPRANAASTAGITKGGGPKRSCRRVHQPCRCQNQASVKSSGTHTSRKLKAQNSKSIAWNVSQAGSKPAICVGPFGVTRASKTWWNIKQQERGLGLLLSLP